MNIFCSTSVRCGSDRETAFRDIAAAGFSTVDIVAVDGWVHLNPSELVSDYDQTARALESQMKKYGLQLGSMNIGTSVKLWEGSDEAKWIREAEVRATCRLMKEFGIRVAAVQPLNRNPNRPAEEAFPDVLASTQQMHEVAESEGVAFAFELHVNSPFESVEECQSMLHDLPDIRLAYDATHFIMSGIDLKSTGWIMDRAIHVHLRDSSYGHMQVEWGAGSMDLEWVFENLKSRNYQGDLSIEYLQMGSLDPIAEAKRLYEEILPYTSK